MGIKLRGRGVKKEGIKHEATNPEENSRRELNINLGGEFRRKFNTFSTQTFLFLARFLFFQIKMTLT